MANGTRLSDDPIELWARSLDLSQRVLPEPGRATRRATVKNYLPAHFLPWEPVAGHQSMRRETSWRHHVYAGLLPWRNVLRAAGLSAENTPASTGTGLPGSEDTDRLVAACAFSVTEDGRVRPHSLELARMFWAAARRAGAEGLSEDFRADQLRWQEQARQLLQRRRVRIQGVHHPHLSGDVEQEHLLDHADLAALMGLTRDFLDAPALVPGRRRAPGVRVESRLLPEDTASIPLLNHPAAERTDQATRFTRYRQGAASLLGVDAPQDQEDVLSDREALYRAVAPQQVPTGAVSAQTPSLSTQFVVNRALAELDERSGVWAAPARTAGGTPSAQTGPDLLAALFTRRALALAGLADPVESFDPEPLDWAGNRQVHQPHPDLLGREAVRAVPGTRTRPGLNPFSATVRILPGMQAHAPYTAFRPEQSVDAVTAVDAVLNALPRRPHQPTPEAYAEWDAAVDGLLEAHEHARALLQERQRYHEAVPLLMRTEEMERDLAETQEEARRTQQEIQERLDLASQENLRDRRRTQRLSNAITAHLGQEPTWWRRLLLGGRRVTSPWRDRLEYLRHEQSQAHSQEQESQARVDTAHRQLRQVRTRLESLQQEEDSSEASVQSLAEELAAYPHPEAVVPRGWLTGHGEDPEAQSPWLDAEVQQARAETYRRAVQLHSLALRWQGQEFRANILAARDILMGRPNEDPEAARAAWQALTMVFPDVGVDAELLPRLLTALGSHRLGWLVFEQSERIHPGVAYAALLNARRGLFLPGGPEAEPAEPLYLSPPVPALRELASTAGCSQDWVERGATAYALARAHSR